MNAITVRKLVKTYQNGDVVTRVLKGIDLEVREGEWIAIMGRSGAGKSTLLYQMSLLDEPSEGEIHIQGREVHHLTERQKMEFRLFTFGYVFQDYALLPELTALENIALPLLMERVSMEHAEAKAAAALERVGLKHRLQNVPSQLSGGEQQRVSIARAIAEKPSILFADEPTANLDRGSSAVIMELFGELHHAGQTIVMVTHEEEYARLTQRTLHLDDGLIISETKNR